MRSETLVLALIASPLFGNAPTTLVHKVYREIGSNTARMLWEKTIIFDSASHFIYLKSGLGSTIGATPSERGKVYLQAPHSDGTYVYIRSSDTSARVDLRGDDGSAETLTLDYTGEFGGTTGDSTFTLKDLIGPNAPIANMSLRGTVAPGHAFIAGFVIPGQPDLSPNLFGPNPDLSNQELLIRVVGPGLAAFGITDAWPNPHFQLFQGNNPAPVPDAIYDDWSSATGAFAKIFSAVGAFALPAGSADAAAVVRVRPGAYTVVCTPDGSDPGGEVLVEVYVLP